MKDGGIVRVLPAENNAAFAGGVTTAMGTTENTGKVSKGVAVIYDIISLGKDMTAKAGDSELEAEDVTATFESSHDQKWVKLSNRKPQTITASDVTAAYGNTNEKVSATTNGKLMLSPADASSRAVVATMLWRFCK